MDQTCSFKNKELLTITKKSGHPFIQQCFVKLCTKFQGKRASRSGTGARGTWQPMIFTYFPSSSPSKFSWHSSFNLARSTCSFYWCYIFSFVIIFTENLNTERRKNIFYSIAIGEQEYSLENTCVRVSNIEQLFYIEHFRWLFLNGEMKKV